MISEKLTEIRKSKGYTMKAVAESIEMKPDTYRNYESGRLEPNLKTLQKLADFYGVTTDYLLGRPEAKPPANPIDEFVSKTNMVSNEQAALKKWLSLDETKRKAVLDIMTEIVHEYESN